MKIGQQSETPVVYVEQFRGVCFVAACLMKAVRFDEASERFDYIRNRIVY
jgi:hypothetical protein